MSVDLTGVTASQTTQTYGIDEVTTNKTKTLDNTQSTPDAPKAGTGVSADVELPTLPAPAGPLSLDTLLSSIGNDVRRQACQDGVNSIEMKGERQAEINKEQLEELAEQLKKMQSKSVADKFLKAFQIIGMIVGAIASAATLAVGVATANPLLIAGGVAGMVMTVDSAMGMATDGKVCISGGITAACTACGMDEEAAKWVGMGVSMALNIATIVFNVGGAARMGAVTADMASKAMQALARTSMITNLVNGVNGVAKGATTIASGVYSYQISQSKADYKVLEAILERIRTSIDFDRDMVEAEMQRANDLLAAVNEIVESCNTTQTSVLTMNPTMA